MCQGVMAAYSKHPRMHVGLIFVWVKVEAGVSGWGGARTRFVVSLSGIFEALAPFLLLARVSTMSRTTDYDCRFLSCDT